jgi:hypothetical protein
MDPLRCPIRLWLVGAALLQAAGSLGICQTTGSLQLGWRHEQGVESRAVVTVAAEVPVHARVRLGGGIAFSMFEHDGLSALGLGVRVGLVPVWDLGFEAELQHEQWNNWQVGENRVLGLVSAQPLGRLELGVGAAWRAPLLDPDRFCSPFDFRSDAPELNLVYRARWRVLAAERGNLAVGISNLAGLRIYTPHHVAVQLAGQFGLSQGWSLTGHAGTALKGLSALVFSVGEFEVAGGVVHEF